MTAFASQSLFYYYGAYLLVFDAYLDGYPANVHCLGRGNYCPDNGGIMKLKLTFCSSQKPTMRVREPFLVDFAGVRALAIIILREFFRCSLWYHWGVTGL